jgi:ribosomal protein L44E
MYPVINGNRMNLRGRKTCLECRPIQPRPAARQKAVRPIAMKKCERCAGLFPAKILIDGKMRSLYRRRFCLQCSPFGSHNTSKMPSGKPIGPELVEERRRRRNAKTYRSLNKRRLRRKIELVTAVGSRCIDCGYDNCLGAMDFHHRDPGTKDFGLGHFNGSLERLTAEAAKCDLLCANCHRKRHASEDASLIDMHPSAESRRRTKLRAVAWFGGRCHGCDEAYPPPVFDFHHWDPREKQFGLATDGIARSWEKVLAELEKCVMLCANCHREVHAGVRTIRPTLLGLAESALPYVA